MLMNPEIISETSKYFVINKPPGIATEPPSHSATLQDWLVSQKMIEIGDWGPDERLGVVHRIDTDTSGLVIWAKNPEAQKELKTLWQGRVVQKTYLALVTGECEKNGVIELELARDNKSDRQQVVWLRNGKGRPAVTKYQTHEVGTVGESRLSLVEVHPITGRTHQIRVHLKAIGHPIVGDKLYGERQTTEAASSLGLDRQFLHAWKLQLSENEKYVAPLPKDLADVLIKCSISLPD